MRPYVAPPRRKGLQTLRSGTAAPAEKVGWPCWLSGHRRDQDSGWRFFAGEESEAYLSDPSHSGVYSLNTICNYDPDLIPLLSAPYGSAFARGEDGAFHYESLEVQ